MHSGIFIQCTRWICFTTRKSRLLANWYKLVHPASLEASSHTQARLYNEFVLEEVNGEDPPTPKQRFTAVIEWTLSTRGKAARSPAADLAAAYLGRYYFSLDDLEHLDVETQGYRVDLVFHNDDIQRLSAKW